MITANSFLPEIKQLALPVGDLSPKSDFIQMTQLGEQMKNAPIQRQMMFEQMNNMRQNQEMNRQQIAMRAQEFDFRKQQYEDLQAQQLDTMRNTLWTSTDALWGQNFLNDKDKATWDSIMGDIDVAGIANLDNQGVRQTQGEIRKRLNNPEIRDIMQRNAQVQQLTDFATKNPNLIDKSAVVNSLALAAEGQKVDLTLGRHIKAEGPLTELATKWGSPSLAPLLQSEDGFEFGVEQFQQEYEAMTGKPIQTMEEYQAMRATFADIAGFNPYYTATLDSFATEISTLTGEPLDNVLSRLESYGQLWGKNSKETKAAFVKERDAALLYRSDRVKAQEAENLAKTKEQVKGQGKRERDPSTNAVSAALNLSKGTSYDGTTQLKIKDENIDKFDFPMKVEEALIKTYTPSVWHTMEQEDRDYLINKSILGQAFKFNTRTNAFIDVNPMFIDALPEVGDNFYITQNGKQVSASPNAKLANIDGAPVLIVDEVPSISFDPSSHTKSMKERSRYIQLGGGYYGLKLKPGDATVATPEQNTSSAGVKLQGFENINPDLLESASTPFGGNTLLGNYLMAMIGAESGWDSGATNATSGASGLLQILPSTLEGMNKWRTKQGMDAVTQEDINGMSPNQVLTEIYPFFTKDLDGDMDLARVRLSLLYPKAAKNPAKFNSANPTAVVFSKTSDKAAYEGNSRLDRHGDGQVTIADIMTDTAKNIPSMKDMFSTVTNLFGKKAIGRNVTSVLNTDFAKELTTALTEYSSLDKNKDLVFTEMFRDPANLPSYSSKNTKHAWGGALDLRENGGGKEFVGWLRDQQKQGRYTNIVPEYHTKGTASHYHLYFTPIDRAIDDVEQVEQQAATKPTTSAPANKWIQARQDSIKARGL